MARVLIVYYSSTGNTENMAKLIQKGAVKVNISTQLKITLADGFKTYLKKNPKEYNPIKLLESVKNNIKEMAMDFIKTFGSEGKA